MHKDAIREAPLDNLNSKVWSHLLTISRHTILPLIKDVYETEQEQEAFYDALKNAKLQWTCFECKKFDSKLVSSDYIQCYGCDNQWYHQSCCDKIDIEKGEFRCQKCKYFLKADPPEDSDNSYIAESETDSD